ncbi:hypothetical protein ACGFZP_12060 [Kitasatospora sp. NPDC048239]|uniref:hypothetical protein n=1 Tax=Kitasatospora sp. NPDC048239 TaxID=3364046 RepID=UPI003719005B
MLKFESRILIRALFVAGLLLSAAVPAMADEPTPGGGTVNHCEVKSICDKVKDPATAPPPNGGGGTGGGGGGGPQVCSWNGKDWPCHDPEAGWFSNSTGCYYRYLSPQPEAGDPAWEGHKPSDGAVYNVSCKFTEDGLGTTEPRFFAQAPAGPPPDDPVALAKEAQDKIDFPDPVPGIAPKGAAVVGVPVWLWLDQSKGPAVPAPVTVRGNTLTVTVTPRLLKVVWDLGDGREETCATAGTPYDPSYGARKSPDCSHRFDIGSGTVPGGGFAGSVTVYWRADVTVTGGTQRIDPLPMILSTPLEVRVAEVQVLN